MVDAEFKPTLRARLGLGAVVALLHLAAVAVLIRAFAPSIGAAIVGPVIQAFDVTIPPPPPVAEPAPQPSSQAVRHAQGAASPAGKKADPRAVVAPPARIALSPITAPAVAANGRADTAGASAAGQGTGAGGVGQGLGAGLSGAGSGGGGSAAKAVKIAGDIVSTRDYPRATRDLRLGSAVTILLTVTMDGRVGSCRVMRPSRDPEADRITCRLATERFRFRPALDSVGRPIEAVYGWQQRWFTPTPG